MPDLNARCITRETDRYELEVFECIKCGYHFGIDGSFLQQEGQVEQPCPSCGVIHYIAGADDADDQG